MSEVKSEWQGGEGFAGKLNAFHKQIEDLHKQWPDEVTAWQREDMHRRYPNTDVSEDSDTTTVETDVWPRSRLDQPGQRTATRLRSVAKRGRSTLAIKPRQAIPKGLGRGSASGRPVLRLELFEKLHDRMMDIAKKAMQWP